MSGLVRKRTRSEYSPVDEEIQFNKRPRSPPVDALPEINKRPRTIRSIRVNKNAEKKIKPKVGPERRSLRIRKNSFESSDGSESSRDSHQSFSCDGDPDISFKTDFTSVFFKQPKLQATTPSPPPPLSIITAPSASNITAPSATNITAAIPPPSQASSGLDDSTEEVDNREVNRRSPNGFLLADPLPRGELLTDSKQQEWVLGKAIGVGGFGELYLASSNNNGTLSPKNYVIKIEPYSNGPLFVEVHFYIRSTRPEQICAFKKQRRLKHLGIPSYIGSGTHEKGGQKYRFLVMQRFGSDLQRILDNSEGGRLTDKTVCEVGLQVLDALQYIHQQGYVHKDVKASNLLVGLGAEGQHKIHLVDYGLCSRYIVGGVHKQYTHDLRWAHEGTLEYTSRDAHIGCSSRRGDIEVLVYNLVEWWGGVLPWDREFATPAAAKVAKFRAFANPHKFLGHCFRGVAGGYPAALLELMNYVAGLRFEENPDYRHLRQILIKEMHLNRLVRDGRLEFRLGSATAAPGSQAENATFLRPLDPETRISAIFDKLCVSTTSWEQTREKLRRARDEASLANPTPAMLAVITNRNNRNNLANNKKRHKSESYFGDGSGYTPAMLAVMQRRKERLAEAEEVQPLSANIIPTNILRVSPVPHEIVMGSPTSLFNRRMNGAGSNGSSPNGVGANGTGHSAASKAGLTRTRSREFPAAPPPARPRELSRLDPFLSDSAAGRMRTRSADVSSAETNRDLRSAFRFGFGSMRSLIRQVSDSFTNMF